MATKAAKNEIRNLNNNDLVRIIANKSQKNGNQKTIFKNIIIQNKKLMEEVIKKVDVKNLGNVIGKEKMLNIIVNDETMLKNARNKTLTQEQKSEKKRRNQEEYERRRNLLGERRRAFYGSNNLSAHYQ